ncbi:glycosyl hydrolase [Legionella birminghamensis]|uniref:beta-N-acetylhexosaminidase n=1 Tax=Legionella birminghamensis TaxID=28083 RepID=A0A378IAT6_9GAMM|nr:glycoside hydrolase family 3 N-terminal domain-containing protein [Legionella birminghamensis]KTC75164.1 glycosyl hydrolase [Legionella birminghamensis]STX31885.1 beta-N-acetylhexosaminidase [Legionella birminghamensis]
MFDLRQKIAQMLIMGFSGCKLNENHPVYPWLAQEGLGGVLLFDYDLMQKKAGKNLVNQEQIRQLTQKLKSYSSQSIAGQQGMDLIIAVDYEGGAVDRFKSISGAAYTVSPEHLAQLDSKERRSILSNMAKMLQNLGFNLNFAPVVDLNINPHEGIIGPLGRCFSGNPDKVNQFALEFIEIFSEYGIHCCYKHFPGHGSAAADTHKGFVDVSESFTTEELRPYQLLKQSEFSPAMVMTAHVINRQLDPSGLPATLSRPILSHLLREQFGYQGIIISDDLQMHAISQHFSMDEALALTINAGADMLIVANQLGTITAQEVIDKIERQVSNGAIPISRIEQAFQRIVDLKQKQVCAA